MQDDKTAAPLATRSQAEARRKEAKRGGNFKEGKSGLLPTVGVSRWLSDACGD